MAHAAQGLGTATAKTNRTTRIGHGRRQDQRTTRSTTATGKPTKPWLPTLENKSPCQAQHGAACRNLTETAAWAPNEPTLAGGAGINRRAGNHSASTPPERAPIPLGLWGHHWVMGGEEPTTQESQLSHWPQHRLQPWDLTTDIGHSQKHRTRRSSTEQPKEQNTAECSTTLQKQRRQRHKHHYVAAMPTHTDLCRVRFS